MIDTHELETRRFLGGRRLLETSVGIVTVELERRGGAHVGVVPPDGWQPGAIAEFGDLRRGLLAAALPPSEAQELAATVAAEWRAQVAAMPPRERMPLRLKLLLPLSAVRALWSLRQRRQPVPSYHGRVRAGSPEFGARRLLRTSVGWCELEFWVDKAGDAWRYGDDGWLVYGRRARFALPPSAPDEALAPSIAAALEQLGVPGGTAETLGRAVAAERLARI